MSTSYLTEDQLARRANALGLFVKPFSDGDYRVCDLRANILFQGNLERCSDFVKGFEEARVTR